MGFLQQLGKQWSRFAMSGRSRFFTQQALENGMLTHTPAKEQFSLEDVKDKLDVIQQNLTNHATLTQHQKKQLAKEAELLSQTELGRFLIANNGALSGWWTHYCILGFKHHKITNPVEKFLLEEAPVVLATRERFGHFQAIIRQVIEKNCYGTQPIKIASIPGGMAADLLTLDLTIAPEHCQLQFVNIDLDEAVFSLSQDLAKQLGCKIPLECRHEDAWSLRAKGEFQLVVSNGLNIYVPEREKVIALYEGILRALKPGGTLITSTLTPPPHHSVCEWKMANIEPVALSRQLGIFAHILQATWTNFCTTEEMIGRLKEAGLVNIKVIPDSRNMFPTFVGQKSSF